MMPSKELLLSSDAKFNEAQGGLLGQRPKGESVG